MSHTGAGEGAPGAESGATGGASSGSPPSGESGVSPGDDAAAALLAQAMQSGSEGGEGGESGSGGGTGSETPEQKIARLTAEAEKWKALSRKHESEARKGKGAIQKLDEMDQASRTEAERLQIRATQAEQERDAAKAERFRLSAAVAYDLPPDLLDYIGGTTEEDANASAENLAKAVNTAAATLAVSIVRKYLNGDGNGAGGEGGPDDIRKIFEVAGNARTMSSRPVESLRPAGLPAGSRTGPKDPEEMFRDMINR